MPPCNALYSCGVGQGSQRFTVLRYLHLYPISVLELIGITQPDIRSDLDDVPRVVSRALLVPYGAIKPDGRT